MAIIFRAPINLCLHHGDGVKIRLVLVCWIGLEMKVKLKFFCESILKAQSA
jgi:hypothetical protein